MDMSIIVNPNPHQHGTLFQLSPHFAVFCSSPNLQNTKSLRPGRPRTGAAVDVGHQAAGGQPATFEQRN